MKKVVLLVFSLFFLTSLFSQEESDIFVIVDSMPTIDGRPRNEFKDWINENLEYPEIAKKHNITGNVYISFIVNERDSITNIELLRFADPFLEDAAIKVLNKSSNLWKSGKQMGKPVKVRIVCEVKFQEESEFNDMILVPDSVQINKNYELGKAYYDISAYAYAFKCFNKVLELSPENSEALYFRGKSRIIFGEKKYACEDWEKAKQLGFIKAGEEIEKHCLNIEN